MKVRVTAEHIAHGTKRSCVSCPIALAVNDAFNPYPAASVSSYSIDFGYYNPDADRTEMVRHVIRRNQKILGFIYDFDRGLPVKPFEFTIRNSRV